MCTLTYIPLGNKDFIFTTNRDENPERIAIPPNYYTDKELESLYPKDQIGNGTWMLCNSKHSICLLNGAFIKHKHNPPYKKSRGLAVLEFSEYNTTTDFVLKYHFDGIEAFTMIVVSYTQEITIEEIRWDGSSVHYKKLDANKAEIWSSSTLYDENAKELRREWFANWKGRKDFSSAGVLNFHKNAGKGNVFNALVMSRKEIVQTTSITQILRENSELRMQYEDLRTGEVTEKYLVQEKSLI